MQRLRIRYSAWDHIPGLRGLHQVFIAWRYRRTEQTGL